jgi:hypothetical protein
VVRRSTLADASERRDWRIYGDFAQHLIATARPLYATEDLGLDLARRIYALDATLIELSVSLFPWARYLRPSLIGGVHISPSSRDMCATRRVRRTACIATKSLD